MNGPLAIFVLLTAICGVVFARYPTQVDSGRIRFKVTGSGLADKDDGLGTSDPYVEVFLVQNGKESKIGKSNVISNSENPQWATVFEFNFNRDVGQQLKFVVWDEDDLRRDDEVGTGWMDATDFVDRGQLANVPLYKKGFLQVATVESGKPTAPRVWPDKQRLRFKLSATNLPDKDDLGTIDPYAEIFVSDSTSSKQTKVGRTGTLTDNKNPSWGDVFDIEYDSARDQLLTIKVYDHDNLREDDKGGVGYVWLEDYVRRGQAVQVQLSKRGVMRVERADGLPAVPPTAPTTTTTTTTTTTPAPRVAAPSAVSAPAAKPTPIQSGKATKLRFRLSAYGLDDKDIVGTSDPYVKVYYSDSSTSNDILIGNTEKLQDTESPTWTKIFDFDYDPAKKPRWRFLVLDEDDSRRDDELGSVYVNVADYVAKNQDFSINLPKGTLNIRGA